jgi:hypothetical protein
MVVLTILPRISFCNGRQGRCPQSPTFYTCIRENGFIVSVGDNQEGKIKLTEIQEINEISENLFIKIKTGESVIIPSRLSEYEILKKQLYDLVEPLGVTWKNQLNWKWK